jgi:hypothetical protein
MFFGKRVLLSSTIVGAGLMLGACAGQVDEPSTDTTGPDPADSASEEQSTGQGTTTTGEEQVGSDSEAIRGGGFRGGAFRAGGFGAGGFRGGIVSDLLEAREFGPEPGVG